MTQVIFTIFGASGDLAKRKLYPSLFRLYKSGVLSEHFAVIGTARRPWTKDFKLVDLEFLCEFIEGIVGVFSLKGCFGKKVRLLINENLPIAMGSTDSDCWV